jgi:hypothetical protein
MIISAISAGSAVSKANVRSACINPKAANRRPDQTLPTTDIPLRADIVDKVLIFAAQGVGA